MGMQKISIEALVRQQHKVASEATNGRSATTVYGGHEKMLRQTLMVLKSGTSMAEHDSPGEATLYVISGRVRLKSGEASWEARTGDLLIIPEARHSLDALEESAVLLSVAKAVVAG